MRCARREAGPPDPAAAPRGRAHKLLSPSSGLTGGRLAAPAGSRRAASPWRRPARLPVLALLLGALGLFAAAPAQAQSQIWSATLTVDEDDGYFGCDNSEATQDNCSSSSVLSEDEFTYNGINYQVGAINWDSATNSLVAVIVRNPLQATEEVITAAYAKRAFGGASLTVAGTPLAISDSTTTATGDIKWSYDPATDWTDNQQVAVKLAHASLGRAGSMSVDGFHPMGPGRMKIAEGASITYGIVIHQPPTADLTITPRHHNVRPDGSDYPNVDNSLLTIHNGVTWKAAPHPNYLSGDWQQAKSVGLTAVDDNECKSPPGTRYWIRHHGSGGGPDWGGWDRQDRHHGLVISIEIIDDDCKYLAASPGQVSPEEGASATYTVRLKTPLEDAAYISPRISVPGDSDPGAVTVSPERIRVEAGDTSPKTFTVSAGRDANSRNEVLVVDHSVDSPEVPADYLGGRVTVIVQDEQNAARTHERDALSVTGLALTAGSEAVALSPAFSTNVLSYRAEVPAGTAGVTLAPHWSGGASVFAGSRRGGTTFTRPARVRPSGTAVALALAPDGGATELWVMASGGSSGMTTYRIEVTEAQAQAPEEQTPPEEEAQTVAVEFGKVPEEHDGRTAFALDVQSGSKPAPEAFTVTAGKVKGVEPLDPVLWRVRVKPESWKDVKIALGAASAKVRGPARIRVAAARAKEGKDASLDFAVTLSRAASGPVSVDYATENGTATAGEDYTAASGTLVFAAGETEKTVSVPLLDDAHDEGKETFTLKLSNPQGAYLRAMHREAKGVIRNEDPLQRDWLARFGRAAAADAVAAVTARLETPRSAGSHLTVGGQRLSLGGRALAEALTGFARRYGAQAPADGLHERRGRPVTGRELLMGTSFRAVLGGGGSRFTGWGSGASVSRFTSAGPGLSLSGEAATGAAGMDYERGRLLTGLAMTHSLGKGAAQGSGRSYAMGSSVTTVLPYARFEFSERVSAWSLAGTGSGRLTLDLDGDAAARHGADLSMTLAAAGVRGEVVTAAGTGGFSLALKADAYWVRTESERVSVPGVGNLAAARADASRLRAVLDGSRAFTLGGGGTLTPSVELGVRHDGGEGGSGTGMEVGAGVGWADPSRGLDVALRVHGLAAHAGEGHREWGVSGWLRLVPGAAGRGLSMSLTPSWGAAPGGSERLWAMPEASRLAANDNAAPSGRLDAEVGYGMAVLGGRFTGTPNLGFGVSDTAREYRMGWRLASVASGFELSLDATRRETPDGDGPPEHGVMLGGTVRW